MHRGYLIFELTCHLPYVKHINERYPEENWLNEAICNTYLPMLRSLRSLDADSIPFKLTLTISPTLVAMLSDPILQDNFVSFMNERIELGKKEVHRTESTPDMHTVAKTYLQELEQNLRDFTELYGCDLVAAFNDLRKKNHINIITTFATHCYMPFYSACEKNIEAQIYTAMNAHSKAFNCNPSGFWLPELGYYPGIEKILKSYRLDYFFTAVHAFLFGSHVPRNGIYAPVNVSGSDVFAFCRDLASSAFVLSADHGYPGDFDYRDFELDMGYDMPDSYIGSNPYGKGIRLDTGFRYYANTGIEGVKNIYDFKAAAEKVEFHADNFIYNLKKRVKKLLRYTDRPPVIVCPYDAQVFGHWWYEGIKWMETVIRKIADDEDLSLIFPDEYLFAYKNNESIDLSYSSLGNGGYSGLWLNGDNDWAYRHIHVIIEKMEELAGRFPSERGLKGRALNHAARELLLAQSSDWAFMMKNGTSAPYANMRVQEHIHNFLKIYNDLSSNSVDTEWLTTVERQNSAFPDIDYRVFT